MGENEKILPERVLELLKENGIIVTDEQAEQILKSGNATGIPSIAGSNQPNEPRIINGYRVFVYYDNLTEEEMMKKKAIVARIVNQGLKK